MVDLINSILYKNTFDLIDILDRNTADIINIFSTKNCLFNKHPVQKYGTFNEHMSIETRSD